MISLSKSGGTVTFSFDDNSGYLQNGTIEVPVNSLSLILDESNMATFRKSASNDIFVSANIAEFGMSKPELESWYKDNMVGSTGGGGGISSGEVQSMIDESISGKADTSAVTEDISAAVSGKADTSAVTQSINAATSGAVGSFGDFYVGIDDEGYEVTYLGYGNQEGVGLGNIKFARDGSGLSSDDNGLLTVVGKVNESTFNSYSAATNTAINGKADTSAVTAVNDTLTAHTADTTIHVTAADKTAWNAKSDFSGSYNDLLDKPTIPTVPTSNTAFTNDAGYITSDALSGYAESSAVTQEISAATSGKADSTDVQTLSGTLTAHTADTTIHVTSSDKSTWSGKQDALVSGTNIKTINNESILGSGNITISGGSGGNPTIELTQAEYDALVTAGTVSANTYYIITDATPVDLSNYYTSAQTQSAITQSVSGKVDTSSVVTAVTSSSTDSEIPSAKCVYDKLGGLSLVKLTQAAYDALSPNYDPNTLYIIKD